MMEMDNMDDNIDGALVATNNEYEDEQGVLLIMLLAAYVIHQKRRRFIRNMAK